MEIQLQELIEQIKKDGVAAAEAESERIIAAARAEADKIIAEAKAEAERAISAARAENERFVRVSEDAIRQAGRNLLISFRESVNRELGAIVGEGVKGVYSSEALSTLIVKAVEAFAKNTETNDISVLLDAKDLQALEDTLISALKAKMLEGVTLKPNNSLDGGFCIAVDGGRVYYDYSAEEVVSMLSAYLSPRVTALLKEAEGV